MYREILQILQNCFMPNVTLSRLNSSFYNSKKVPNSPFDEICLTVTLSCPHGIPNPLYIFIKLPIAGDA